MKVTIIITAYNVGKYIEKALESAVSQDSWDNVEVDVVVVEDKSTDNTLVKCLHFRDDHPGVVSVLQNQENRGAGLSRRRGIEAATGDYIMLLDGDDWLDEGYVSALAHVATDTGADIVTGGVTVHHPDGTRDITLYPDTTYVDAKERVTAHWGERIQFMNNKLIRLELAKKVPYCHRRFIEDTPTIIPLLYLAEKVAYVDGTRGYNYRMRESSLSHTSDELRFALYRALCYMDLTRFFEQWKEEDIIKAGGLRDGIRQQLAILKRLKPTPKDVKPYIDDWADLTCRIFGMSKKEG